MAMRTRPLGLLLGVALAAALPWPVRAQSSTEARLRDALRTTTQQLREAEDERARLRASEASLREELEKAHAQGAAAAAAPRRSRASERELEELKGKLDEANRKLAAQDAKATASAAECDSRVMEAGQKRDQAQGELADLRKRLAEAVAKNARMYAVGKEIIDWLSSKGFATALAAREPFLGLKRVELENAAQDYQDKLADQRFRP